MDSPPFAYRFWDILGTRENLGPLPDFAITDPAFFPFYSTPMTFEEFMPEFSQWLANNNTLATLVGIRTDESLIRYLSIISKNKLRYADDIPWTTASLKGFSYNVYPIYDWKITDIWTYTSKMKVTYNGLYELMYKAGVPPSLMRVCEPFGPEQRKGLWLYHVLEFNMWCKICQRVSGANSGAMYAAQRGEFYAHKIKLSKPARHT